MFQQLMTTALSPKEKQSLLAGCYSPVSSQLGISSSPRRTVALLACWAAVPCRQVGREGSWRELSLKRGHPHLTTISPKPFFFPSKIILASCFWILTLHQAQVQPFSILSHLILIKTVEGGWYNSHLTYEETEAPRDKIWLIQEEIKTKLQTQTFAHLGWG